MRLFNWSFPQTTPIVVSRILRVHGLSGHELGNKNLQNKQVIGDGVPVGSPMLKLVKEIQSILTVGFASICFHIFFLSVTSLIYEKG